MKLSLIQSKKGHKMSKKFNLAVEKGLENNRKEQSTENSGVPTILDKQLKVDRTELDGLDISEKQLKDTREKDNDSYHSIEKLISSKEHNKDYPSRNVGDVRHEVLPINALESVEENKRNEAFDRKSKKGEIKSQLHNNENRFKKLKENSDIDKVEKMVFASLQDQDAVLYHIYRKAFSENRNITSEEQNIVDRINSEKINILSEFYEV